MKDLISSIGEALPEGVDVREVSGPLNGRKFIRCNAEGKSSRANPSVVFAVSEEALEDYEIAVPRAQESARVEMRKIVEDAWASRTSADFNDQIRGVLILVFSADLRIA